MGDRVRYKRWTGTVYEVLSDGSMLIDFTLAPEPIPFFRGPYRGWRLALIGPIAAVVLLVEWAYWEFSERIFGWRNH